MATGDIGPVIDNLNADNTQTTNLHAVRVNDTIYAIAYTGSASDGYLKTFSVDADGNLGAVIATWEFDILNCSSPNIIHIAGDVYAVAWGGGAAYHGYIKTLIINADGTLGVHPIQTLEYDALFGVGPAFLHISGTTYALAYRGDGNDGWLKTVSISDDGTAMAIIDDHEFDGVQGDYCELLHISGTIYAIAYRGSTHWRVLTYPIAADGTIGAQVDALDVALKADYFIRLVHIAGDIYALGYRTSLGAAVVSTLDIDSAGNIGAVLNTHEFNAADAGGVRGFLFLQGDNAYAIPYQEVVSFDGYVKTITINDDGSFGAEIDDFEFNPVHGQAIDILWHGGNIYVLVYTGSVFGSATTCGCITTLNIETWFPKGKSRAYVVG